MNIIEHFSCHTKLPVPLHEVAEHVKDNSPLDELYRASVDISPDILHAIYRQYRVKAPYAVPGGNVVGEIIYSQHLGPLDARFAQCKEMLHAFDKESDQASELADVERLSQDIIIPFDLLVKSNGKPANHVISDQAMVFAAIGILLPRDFLDEIGPLYRDKRVTVKQISQYAKVPTKYVRHALRPDWGEFINNLT